MFNYFKIITLLFSLSFVHHSFAHDSNIATFHIRHMADDLWVYELMTPLHGLDTSLREAMKGDTGLANLAQESTEYKQKLITHIKIGFDVSAMEYSEDKSATKPVKLSLGKGRIKLNEHQSVFIFEIKGMPKDVMQLDFRLASMSNNDSQNNLLRLIDGQKTKKYLLNQSNDFSGQSIGFFHSVIPKTSS